MLMNILKSYKIWVVACILITSFGSSFQEKEIESPAIDKDQLLERHNYYRAKLGVPPLEWSDELAAFAQNWANHLAKSCDLEHSDGNFGENLYWTSGTATPNDVVDLWASEEKNFNHTKRTYKSGTGHYSQLIWRETTHVGGAMQQCKHGGEIWVCSYDPAGNVIGQKAY